MKRSTFGIGLTFLMLFLLSGCGIIGDKSTSMSIIYAATAVLSLMLLIACCRTVGSDDPWFLLLFSAVFVVNCGYFFLSVCRTLEAALWANRVAYLGSVFLPLSILMVILNLSGIQYRRWLPPLLIGIGIVVFAIAATPGYSNIYYRDVTLEFVDGVAVLNKIYGPLHSLYLFYLLFYFSSMVAVVIYVPIKKKLPCAIHTVILAGATLVNIGVWLLEQLVEIDFEFLSVSYIISELFLLGVKLMIREMEERLETLPQISTNSPASPKDSPAITAEQRRYFAAQLPFLTATERTVFDLYVQGKATKEVLVILGISENTLKYHNRNIYSKLGVSSRKQLRELAAALDPEKDLPISK